MDNVGHLLCRILGVLGLIQQFSILPGFRRANSVDIHPFVPKLGEEFSSEHHRCNVPRRDQEQFTSMSQLPQPEVVSLLVQQGCHWKLQWVAAFDVQLLAVCRLTNGFRKSQAVDLLVVIVIFVLLPLWTQIESIGACLFSCGMSPW